MSPATAVRGFLDALGMPPTQIPDGLQAQTALYRSLLSGRRVLVVIDNARDADQVRPLLPGSPGCLAIVTSRHQLTGLVATDGARPLVLDLLSDDEARDLLARRLGQARIASDPHAVDEIVTGCARLPLALSIAAARAATTPTFPLAAVATELREAGCTLDPFDAGDEATDVRAVFSWSYHALSAEASALFRLLGLYPGCDIESPAIASLAGESVDRIKILLAELTRANLLTEYRPFWYSIHDLLRAYAAELLTAHDSPQIHERRLAPDARALPAHRPQRRGPDGAVLQLPRPAPGARRGHPRSARPAPARRRPGSPPSTPACSRPSTWPRRRGSTPSRGNSPGPRACSSCATVPGTNSSWSSESAWTRLAGSVTRPAKRTCCTAWRPATPDGRPHR